VRPFSLPHCVDVLRRSAALIGIALVAASCGGHHRRLSEPDRGRFTARVRNPWFPLAPGTTLVYRGVKDGEPSRDVLHVRRATKTIDGAACAVVSDRLYIRGRLAERTTDWYTQDAAGNVWYFGEDTAELDRSGHVTSTEGTWQAGRGGAKAGIFMPARPKLGETHRQEYYKGHAEDHFQVLSLASRVAVPAARSSHALLTKETTPLEPGVVDHKYYVRGIGTVLEQTIKGGDERNALVSVTRS
jgi:hypothetical protein